MTMQTYVHEMMRSRRQIWLTALLFSVVPFFSWVSVVIMALVTLHKGIKEGLWLLCLISGPIISLGGSAQLPLSLYEVLTENGLVLLLAVVLRSSGSWMRVLQIGAVLGMLGVFLVHSLHPDIHQWWVSFFDQQKEYFTYFSQQANATDVQTALVHKRLMALTYVATGLQIAILLSSSLGHVLLARWMQAKLYNPGGLRQELQGLRVDKVFPLLVIACALAAKLEVYSVLDALPVLLLPCLLVGLALLHELWLQANKVRTIVFYIAFVVFFQYMGAVVVMIALMDSYIDFRARSMHVKGRV